MILFFSNSWVLELKNEVRPFSLDRTLECISNTWNNSSVGRSRRTHAQRRRLSPHERFSSRDHTLSWCAPSSRDSSLEHSQPALNLSADLGRLTLQQFVEAQTNHTPGAYGGRGKSNNTLLLGRKWRYVWDFQQNNMAWASRLVLTRSTTPAEWQTTHRISLHFWQTMTPPYTTWWAAAPTALQSRRRQVMRLRKLTATRAVYTTGPYSSFSPSSSPPSVRHCLHSLTFVTNNTCNYAVSG